MDKICSLYSVILTLKNVSNKTLTLKIYLLSWLVYFPASLFCNGTWSNTFESWASHMNLALDLMDLAQKHKAVVKTNISGKCWNNLIFLFFSRCSIYWNVGNNVVRTYYMQMLLRIFYQAWHDVWNLYCLLNFLWILVEVRSLRLLLLISSRQGFQLVLGKQSLFVPVFSGSVSNWSGMEFSWRCVCCNWSRDPVCFVNW